jgi:TPR repeat protein
MRAIRLVLALIWLPLAASAQDVEAGLAALAAGDPAGAAEIWRHAADAGDADAMARLGELYEDGLGVPADPVAAHALYRQSAALGHARGQSNLA